MRFEGSHSRLVRRCIVGCASYAPELDKRCLPNLRSTNNSWRVDETYIEVKGEWKYLYRGTTDLLKLAQPYINISRYVLIG